MKLHLLSFLIILGISQPLICQEAKVSGSVSDKQNKRALAYVQIQFRQSGAEALLSPLAAITDEEGRFSIVLPTGAEYWFEVSHLGYQTHRELVSVTTTMPEVRIEITASMLPLGEVRVSSLRYERAEKEIAAPMVVVPRDYIPRQSALTISDVLGHEPGLATARDGAWATSLSIRGLGENRMVSLIDGVRLETATDLAGALSLIDPSEIERIEVIKGAASSIYGTGAMAGVLNVVTRRPLYSEGFVIHGDVVGLFEGVNRLGGTHVGIEASSKYATLRLSGGYRNAGDVKTPEGVIENSQFQDQNLNMALTVRPHQKHELDLVLQRFKASNAGIPGGAPFGAAARATYLEAARNLYALRYTVNEPGDNLNQLNFRAYHQYIGRDVEMLPNMPSVTTGLQRLTVNRIMPVGLHYTQGGSIDSKWKLGRSGNLIAGIDVWQRRLLTTREKYITQEILDDFQMVVKTLSLVRGEKPNPDSKFNSAGLFVQHEVTLNERLDLQSGIRTDAITVTNDEAHDPVFLMIDGIAKDPVPGQRVVFEANKVSSMSFSANASALYHLTSHLDITLNLGRSFRSPSLEERFKYIDLGSKVRLGNPDLKPEKGWFGDLGLRLWRDRLQVQANAFVHHLTDMIVEQPGEFVYYLTSGEAGLTDTLPALVNANVDKALLFGGEYSINYQVLPGLVLLSRGAMVIGSNLTQEGPLPMIAPFYGEAGFRYQLPGVFSVEWITRAVASQKRVAGGETPTEGYLLTNLSLYSFPKQIGKAGFQLFAGVDNLFNATYENHLATNRGLITFEPGRNIYVKLVMKF